MSMEPLVSVVIPCYNHAGFVGPAMDSVFRQTWRNLELIVVDDGSTDGSADVVRDQIRRNPQCQARLITQGNAGAHAALNRGLGESQGAFLAILNSDDLYVPERLATLCHALEEGDGLLAFSEVDFIDGAGRPQPPDSPWRKWYLRGLAGIENCPTLGFALLTSNFTVSSSNFLFRRELWTKLEAFSPHRFCHDWDFLMRSVLQAEPCFVRKPLLGYRIHETNSTAALRGVQEVEVMDALNRYLALACGRTPGNPLAPSPSHWPSTLPMFLSRRPFHFDQRVIKEFVIPSLLPLVCP